jgi:alanine dehydrogenase
MTIFLDEACIAKLVTMRDAIEAVEEVFGELGRGNVVNVPRVRAPLNNGILRISAAVLNYRGYYGIKVSSTSVFGRNAGRLFCLYKEEGGELCAIMQVFGLGALRTGAASGVATRYMARENAHVLGVIGTGRQARTQIEAIANVRPITDVRVFGRDKERRESFCREIKSTHKLNVIAVATAEQAVIDSDIVVTATTSSAPVLFGAWLKPGAHVNAIGANYEHRRELDLKVVERVAVIATDDLEQVRHESSDLADAVEKAPF